MANQALSPAPDRSSNQSTTNSKKRDAAVEHKPTAAETKRRQRHQLRDLDEKRFELPLAPTLDWTTLIAAADSAEKRGDLTFAKNLTDKATLPITSYALVKETLRIHEMKRLDMIPELLRTLRHPIQYDVLVVHTHDELHDALRSEFNFIRISQESELAHTHHWTIQKQFGSMGNVGSAYSAGSSMGDKLKSDTQFHTKAEAHERMSSDDPRITINLLDIKNTSSHDFRPSAIAEVDLLVLCKTRIENNGAWSRSEFTTVAPYDCILMTKGPEVTSFHADAAGYGTAVVGLEGEKAWYSPKGLWDHNRVIFAQKKTSHTSYGGGIFYTMVREGDCIIQAPGTVHAVITTGRALVAGAIFYTAAHFARSIKCIKLGFEKKLPSNDEVTAKDFVDLTLIKGNLDRDDLFDAEQRGSPFMLRLESCFQSQMSCINRKTDLWRGENG